MKISLREFYDALKDYQIEMLQEGNYEGADLAGKLSHDIFMRLYVKQTTK